MSKALKQRVAIASSLTFLGALATLFGGYYLLV
jgi:hypothetical protein